MAYTFDDITALIKANDIKMVDFKTVDLAGKWRHLTIPAERFRQGIMEDGIGFDGSSYGFMSVDNSDMVFIPDLSTAFVDPAAEMPTVAVLSDIYRIDGDCARYEGDPRYIAEKAEDFLRDGGISDRCLFGPEFEFYILDHIEFRNEINHIEVHLDSAQAAWNSIDSPFDASGNKGYKVMNHGGYHADLPHDASYALRNEMARALEDNGVPVKYHHGENGGPGQVEIEIEFSTLRETADRSQKLKYLVKNIAMKNGKTVTFMPKPFYGECGSGMHVHLQMFNGGAPVFYDANGYSNLSATALHAISGILGHAPALTAIACPTTNSYKRLVPGYEAPVTVCFATANRSSVIRIPGYAKKPEDKRFEFRPSDAMSNPYLCLSALAMAAADGIINKTDPSERGYGPYDKNMYYLTEEEKKTVKSLPKSLNEAADALEADHGFLLRGNVFTREVIDSLLRKLRKDAEEVNITPHPLEFKKYYDM